MDLVLDIGNFRIKGALFEEDALIDRFATPIEGGKFDERFSKLKVEHLLISSVNPSAENVVEEALQKAGLPFHILDFSEVHIELDVEEPEAVGHDRIANVYGALHHFSQNECVVVDLGTAVTFDVIGSNGSYLGGAILPGGDICAEALARYTEKIPKVPFEVPENALGKTTEEHVQSGLYWGLLGSLERITFELRQTLKNPSNVKVLATGGLIDRFEGSSFTDDINEFADLIDPNLTLVGLREILLENKEKYHV